MLEYKAAEMQDAPVIFSLNRQLIDQYEDKDKIDYAWIMDWVKRKILRDLAQYKSVWYQGRKAGYFLLRETEGLLELDDLFVLEDFQDLGIGTEILRHCIETGCDKGLPICLFVFIRNERAVKLYERMGFRIIDGKNARVQMRHAAGGKSE